MCIVWLVMDRSDPLESLLSNISLDEDMRNFLINIGKEINNAILKYINMFDLNNRLKSAVTHLLGKGKNVRSIFSYLLSLSLGIEREKALKLASAIEYSHLASLIHDDIIDNASQRRGRESVHKRYGVETAIVAGDALILISNYLTNDLGKEALKESLIAGLKMCSGEILELLVGENADLDTYMKIIYQKTASFFEHIARVNAVLANLEEELVNKYGELGKAIGIAFQIRDDILDIIGDEKVLGKPVNQDLNKPNIVRVIQKEEELSLKEAIKKAQEILDEWVEKSVKILNNLNLKSEYMKLLNNILISMKYRLV